MKTQNIQEKINKKEKEIIELKQKLAEEQNKNTWIRITGTDYEVEKEVHHKGKSYNELVKEFGEDYLKEHLLTLKLIGEICEHPELMKELKMDSSSTKDDFFFKQPFPQNGKDVARFFVDSDYACLYCRNDADYSGGSLGVRFAKKIKGDKK